MRGLRQDNQVGCLGVTRLLCLLEVRRGCVLRYLRVINFHRGLTGLDGEMPAAVFVGAVSFLVGPLRNLMVTVHLRVIFLRYPGNEMLEAALIMITLPANHVQVTTRVHSAHIRHSIVADLVGQRRQVLERLAGDDLTVVIVRLLRLIADLVEVFLFVFMWATQDKLATRLGRDLFLLDLLHGSLLSRLFLYQLIFKASIDCAQHLHGDFASGTFFVELDELHLSAVNLL